MNSLVNAERKTFSNYITSDGMKKKINEMIGSSKGQSFVTSIISAVSNNPKLQECDNSTILSASLVGEALNLSPSPFMGQYFLVPFEDNKNKRMVAQFQIGYKGFIQLAMRSGQYRDIDVMSIKEGEFLGRDKETGKPIFSFIADEDTREKAKTIGYMAYFELLNGFKKVLYWSKEKMETHAYTYSQGYRSDKNKGNKYTFWSKNFDEMAYKTMLRQLISKWGIMSIEMQKAYENDMAVIRENGEVSYVDNAPDIETTFMVADTIQEEPKDISSIPSIIADKKTGEIKATVDGKLLDNADIINAFQQQQQELKGQQDLFSSAKVEE